MSGKLTIIENDHRALTATDMRAHVNLVQEVMQAVMKEDTHFGIIPGTKKPSLYKPGAEVLAATFRIAVSYRVEDLSADGEVRYRVAAVGTHQTSGIVLGEGMGECSSGEEKFRWRRAICDEEFELASENRRRIKFSSYQGKVSKTKQVRTEPSDQANTILKMACKRAQVAMTLNVTAASDIFTQDIEDLPDELREPEEAAPARPALSPYSDAQLTANQESWCVLIADGRTPADIITTIKSKYSLTPEQEAKIKALAKPVGPVAPTAPADAEWLAGYARGEKGEQQ